MQYRGPECEYSTTFGDIRAVPGKVQLAGGAGAGDFSVAIAAMSRNGALTVTEFPGAVGEVHCTLCDRCGRYFKEL